MKNWISRNVLSITWLQVFVSTLGSLYFSEVLKIVPGKLCWFQRVFMYPLLFILAVGISTKDKKLYRYVFPLSISGWFVALYQNFEYYGFMKGTELICTLETPCNVKYINWFGFVSIPLLSLIAFSVINVGMIIYKREVRKTESSL